LGTAPATHASLDDWKVMIDTNITALATLTHRLLPKLVERRGAIINVSSVAGVYPYPGGNVYGGTKAFVSQFSPNLRSDLHGTCGRVSRLRPRRVAAGLSRVRTRGSQAAPAALNKDVHRMSAGGNAEQLFYVANLRPPLSRNRLEIMPMTQSFAGFQVHRG